MQGLQRKIVYVALYEIIAIAIVSFALAAMSDHGLAHATVLGLLSSVIAVMWNLVFNGLFERWESRQATRGRSIARRIVHALGFEGGLILMLVPLYAWWLDVSLWQALVMDIGLVLFFLFYTFSFNWLFDRVFGLPASAAPA